MRWAACRTDAHYLQQVFKYLPVCASLSWQEADGDDRLGLQGDTEGECDSKADTPDVPLSTADTDNTPQCLNKALEGLPPRYTPDKTREERCQLVFVPDVHTEALITEKILVFSTFSTYQSKLILIVVPCFYKVIQVIHSQKMLH